MRRRAFDKTGKGAVDFGEFYDLHVFILRTQASFESLLPNGSKHLPYEQVSQALQRAGARTHRTGATMLDVQASEQRVTRPRADASAGRDRHS